MQKNISVIYVTGGTGFVGSELTKQWIAKSKQNRVIVQTRCPEQYNDSESVKYVRCYKDVATEHVDAVINLAGAPIADKRWSAKRKSLLCESRVALSESLVEDMALSPPKVVVSASAIGFYGLGDSAVDELDSVGEGFASDLCKSWEQAIAPAAEYSRLVVFRLGVVLGDGGMMAKLLPLYRLGLGGPVGKGNQWLSWVHIDDVIEAILQAVGESGQDGTQLKGTYNLTSPEPVQQKLFAKTLGNVLGRSAFVPTPAFVFLTVFGEMGRELLLGGQRVFPNRLLETGYQFSHPDLKKALTKILRVI